MKIIRFSILTMLILTLTLVIASCDVADLRDTPAAREVSYQFNQLEDRIENQHRVAPSRNGERVNSTEPADQTEQTAPLPEETRGGKTNRKTDKDFVGEVALTYEEAETVALEHAGVPAEDALYLRTELDREDGIPVYEVEFSISHPDGTGLLEYEYTIHADTGKILEFETDFEHRR